ncbi:solute carrier family 46 member 3-like [Hydractinia symbiolongicarpus]|uniref:solute carrier family 46 member 3-like n=1 Tax=Hydractinia symbiolongicarpus TaxID=13093 RepID=UPI00254E36ED|nr:solute carrier family 46 member 3-like [Hydractinia symbiolongicarpus]
MEGQQKSLINRLQNSPEAIIILYLFAVMFVSPIQEQYLYEDFSRQVGFNYSHKGSTLNQCPTNKPMNSTNRILQKKVQSKVATFLTRTQLCTALPATFLCLFLGPVVDRFGRKPVIVYGITGTFFGSIVLVLMVTLKLNINFIYLSSLLFGLSGYYNTIIMAVAAYLSDIVDKELLALRIAIVDMLVFAGITLSNYSSGVFLQKFGFQASFISVSAAMLVASLCAMFLLKESLPVEKRLKGSMLACSMPCQACRVMFSSRPKKWKFLTYAAINLLLVLSAPGSILPVMVLYFLNTPFCWSPQNIGYYRGTFFAVSGIGCVIGVKILRKIFSDNSTLVLSILSSAGYLVVIAFSKTMLTAYLGLLACIFGFVSNPILSGSLSGMVKQTEQGSLFAFLNCFRTMFTFFGNLLYQKFYQALNEHDRAGGTFIIGSFTCVFPLLLILLVRCKDTQRIVDMQNNNVDDHEKKPLLET